jgi:hypothetical protein
MDARDYNHIQQLKAVTFLPASSHKGFARTRSRTDREANHVSALHGASLPSPDTQSQVRRMVRQAMEAIRQAGAGRPEIGKPI